MPLSSNLTKSSSIVQKYFMTKLRIQKIYIIPIHNGWKSQQCVYVRKPHGHWGSWPGGRRGLSPPAAPGFESSCARLSPPRCLPCPLGLQGVQWAVGLVVVRASWPGHPRKSKKRKPHGLVIDNLRLLV